MKNGSVKSFIGKLTSPLRDSIYNGYIENADKNSRSRRQILVQYITYSITNTLTTGIFLTGLILYILKGEPESVQNEYIGLITTFHLFAGFFQIITPFMTAKMKSYKVMMVIARVIYFGLSTVGIAIVPMLPIAATSQANLFVGMTFAIQLSISLMNPAIVAWHISNIPDDKRADWYSIQQMILPIINTLSSLAAGFLIDQFELKGKYMSAVLIIRGLLLICAFFEIRTHFIVKEPIYNKQQLSIKQIVTEPIKCKPFLLMVMLVCIWNIGGNFVGQYFNAYLLTNVKVSYTFINLCTATNIPIMLITMPIWNRIVHKKGWLWTLSLATSLYCVPFILYQFIFQETSILYLISTVYTNMIAPGINLCVANLVHIKCPADNKTSFIAFYSAIGGLASTISSYIGKTFIKYTDGITIHFGNHQVVNTQYICLIALAFTIITSIVAFTLSKLDKKGKLKIKQ